MTTTATTPPYAATEPTRAEVDALAGATLVEFGAPWCGICAALQPLLAQVLAARTGVRHLKIEDGRGRPLGRSFGVKLWPTLVLLRDGREVARLVRPQQRAAIDAAINAAIDAAFDAAFDPALPPGAAG